MGKSKYGACAVDIVPRQSEPPNVTKNCEIGRAQSYVIISVVTRLRQEARRYTTQCVRSGSSIVNNKIRTHRIHNLLR